jgi:hypothetical protein
MFGSNKRKNSQPNIFELAQVGVMIYGAMKDFETVNKLIDFLENDPINPDVHNTFLEGIKKIKKPNPVDTTSRTYSKVLSILLMHPDDGNVLNLVKEVGKWHYEAHDPPKYFTTEELSRVQQRLADIKNLEIGITHFPECSDLFFDQAVQIAEELDDQKILDPIGEKYDYLKGVFLENFIEYLLEHISLNSSDINTHKLLLDSLKKTQNTDSLKIYNSILNVFQNTSSQQDLKVLVLEVGRWHFGRQRFWGKPKASDEQTIQNDILMRIKQ